MSGTSAGTGYLPPTSPAPAEDQALDLLFQAAVAGITGLPGRMVRPRWQPVPPLAPEATENWCAMGVTVQTPDAAPAVVHVGDGEGHSVLQRHEELTVALSFYGPAAGALASRMRDGLGIAHNRYALRNQGVAFVAAGAIVRLPELRGGVWGGRYDLTLTFRRQVSRRYDVLNLLSAQGSIRTDRGDTPWSVEP